MQLLVKAALKKIDFHGVVFKENVPVVAETELKRKAERLRNKAIHKTAQTIPIHPKMINIDLQPQRLTKKVTRGAPITEAKGTPKRPKEVARALQLEGIQSVTVRIRAGK